MGTLGAAGRGTVLGWPARPDCRRTGNRSAPRPPREWPVLRPAPATPRRSATPRPLAAPHALSLCLEKLRDELPLAQARPVPRDSTVVHVRRVIGRPDDAPHDPGDTGVEGQCRIPHPASRISFSLPSHTPSPHTGSRASPPACGPRAPATTLAVT